MDQFLKGLRVCGSTAATRARAAAPSGGASAAAAAFAVCLLAGCAGPGPASTAPAASSADQRAAAPAALVVERQWLQAWFKDTPVVIAQHAGGAVTIDVPREYCFDPRRSTVKPALGAVLDKVAESLRRQPQLRLTLLAAPDDAAGTAPLAMQRAAQLQQHLTSRGAPGVSLGKPTATPVAAVQLRLEALP